MSDKTSAASDEIRVHLLEKRGMTAEVSVVGGSAAGFFTAYLLARRGLGVSLFEAGERLEPAARTLIVTHRMSEVLGPVGKGAVINEIRRFELFTDGQMAAIALERPDLIVERSKLIQELAGRAKEAGAQVFMGRRFTSLQPNGNGLKLTLGTNGNSEEVLSKTVVGADGASGRVAQAAGWPKQATAPLVQAIVRLPKGLAPDTVRVWFIPDDTPYFFWLIPESPVRGAVGLIGEDGARTRRCLERFLEKHDLSPIEFQAARIPLYTHWLPVSRRIGSGHVYLVGDAAGHVKVSTVGGIVTGFRGARGVAEAILNGGSSRELRALRRELDLHLLIRRAIHEFTQADYSRLVDLLNGTTRCLLGAYSRDDAAKMLWRICLKQPRLLLLGARAILTSSFFPRQRES